MGPTPAVYARVEGEHRTLGNPLQPLTLHRIMADFKMPGASIPKRVKLSRALLILSLCVIVAAFGSQNTDAPPRGYKSIVVPKGNTNTGDVEVNSDGRSFHRHSSVFLGVEAADSHSGKEQQSYATASTKGNDGWQSRRAVYGGQHTPHPYDEHRSVPSQLIMRAAIEEALSTLENRSHGVAESGNVEHSPSTIHEAENFHSYENVAHEPTEGNTHVNVYSEGVHTGDGAAGRGPHDSHEQWAEEHTETLEDVEHTEVHADPMHRVRRRHRVYGGSKSKNPAEAFNQYESLVTVVGGPDAPDKGVSVSSDVLEPVAEPIISSPEAELEAALKRGESRVLGLPPVAFVLTAVLLAVALMLAQSHSDAAKDFFQHSLLPGRRQASRGYLSHPMVNDHAENRYFERGYIADPGEDGAGQHVAWMRGGDDETRAIPYDNDFRTREIERRVIRLDSGKEQRLKNSTMGSLQTAAYRAEQADSTEGLREPFAVPAGASAETMYKGKGDYHNVVDNSSHGALEAVESEDDEDGAHHR